MIKPKIQEGTVNSQYSQGNQETKSSILESLISLLMATIYIRLEPLISMPCISIRTLFVAISSLVAAEEFCFSI
jgi:hypothetical protein